MAPRRPRSIAESRASAPAPAAPPAAVDYRRFLDEHYGIVTDAVRFVASRNHLTRDVGEELKSRVLLHLTQNDYAVLRRWRQEGSLHTYLVTVTTRLFLDYRNEEWGKTKPPAIVRRLGDQALALWRLTHRKRLSFDEAVATLSTASGVAATRDELWAIYARLPVASGRYYVDTAELDLLEQPGTEADALVAASERSALARQVERALGTALEGLDREDRLILKLFFHDGLSRAEIARALRLDQPRLYPRFHGLIGRLRTALSALGVTAADVRQIVGDPDLEPPSPVLDPACKTRVDGPSQPMDGDIAPTRRPRLRES